ncbi:tyrosine-type recombinase/integrase [Caldifermentibacillus hisashii]|uniref:tyrosine-type recombinase/integrase n=1 Tax=Caldifermentibacillus hisashii TaxID=996558 RepID=UPI002DFFBAB2|nr:tyrosine-type recombinase/integrase [Caldifermentibacillus hisashii]MEC5272414.1 tyrosine-type recombinase/integrase [Caldifermentibacillus hisashii]
MRRKNELSVDELKVIKADLSTDELTLTELIEAFLDDCKLRNLREHSIRYYRNELGMFKRLINTENIAEITPTMIKNNVIRALMDRGNKPVSINTRLRAIRVFFNFLVEQKYIKSSPMDSVSMLKHDKNKIQTLSIQQINELLNACNLKTFVGYRDYTIISLFIETGVRALELVNIDVYDVDLSRGMIRIKHPKSHLERNVPIQKSMREILNRYMTIRGDLETDRLFVTIDGTPLSKRQMQKRIEAYGKKAGIKGVRCSCHTLRHTFAKLCVLNGANAFQLQAILGHSTLDMTKIYVNLFGNEVIEGHKKFSPLQNIRRKK